MTIESDIRNLADAIENLAKQTSLIAGRLKTNASDRPGAERDESSIESIQTQLSNIEGTVKYIGRRW